MLSEEQRIFLNEFVKGKWSITKKSNLVNVDGDIDFSHKDRHIILCNFNRVKGDFICSHNNLIWTNGAPKITEGDLDCSYNKTLVQLDFSESEVWGDFKCNSNNIKSLVGLPKKVKGAIRIGNFPIVSLDGIQDIEYKELQIDFIHKDILSQSTLNILLKNTLEYKEYCYILPVVLSLLEIKDPSDIEKITSDILPHYYDPTQYDEISEIIINRMKLQGEVTGDFPKILYEKINPIYNLLNTKIGGILEINNTLLDLGFNF